jgi:hypothetical protein
MIAIIDGSLDLRGAYWQSARRREIVAEIAARKGRLQKYRSTG